MSDIVADLGYAGFAGFVVGFAVKRVLNIFMMLVGLYVLSLLWLESKGVIDIHWSAFLNVFKSMFDSFNAFVTGLVRKFAVSASFAAGFFLGFRT